MKIELEYPYSEDFKAGYLVVNKEPRRTLCLIKYDKSRTSTSYARYLMSIKIGRYLEENEHVDHIDGDSLNDNIDNLQILSPSENNRKRDTQLGIKETIIQLVCPVCKSEFSRSKNRVSHKLKNGKTPCCSRKCGGIHSHKNK